MMRQPDTLDEAFQILENRTNLEKGIAPGNPNRVYRLDRMRALSKEFDNPQESMRIIHIAGSKGKGSTAAYLAALLHSAGRKVGVYSSPHLIDYRERFRVQGSDFPETTALDTVQSMLTRLSSVENHLPGNGAATTFELLTLFAFLFFRDAGCDTVILETGLGGRLDATNIVKQPEAVLLTPIEKEHVEILGHTLSAIASEKAGIMKSGSPVWCAKQAPIVRRVFKARARALGIPLTFLRNELRGITPKSPDEQSGGKKNGFQWELQWKNGVQEDINLSMGGRIQAENAALALLVAGSIEPSLNHSLNGNTSLRPAGFSSLSLVRLPGRFQLLSERPLTVIDGAHTPHSVNAVAQAFTEIAPENPLLVFGCVLGKNHRKMAKILCGGPKPYFTEVIISTPGHFKPSDPVTVAAAFERECSKVQLISDPKMAWEEALRRSQSRRPILVCGSFFMAGEIARLQTSPGDFSNRTL